MKRSRSGKGSTSSSTASPNILSNAISQAQRQQQSSLILNHNSNSCSNDTNFSIHSGHSLTPDESQILLKENKIRSLLKDLQFDVKKCQEERLNLCTDPKKLDKKY